MENTSLDEKVKNLEVELSQAKTQIEMMSSAKLDEVLSAQKPSSDKTGVGYVDFFGPSSSTASRSKTVFMRQFEKVDKGNKSITDMSYSNTFVRPHSRKSSSSKTTHVCHRVVFMDTLVLTILSCILISKCQKGLRILHKFLHLFLESY